MLSTSIRHGDLVIDFDSEGWVQISRQSNAMSIQLSKSEWTFLLKCVDLRGWPTCAPTAPWEFGGKWPDKPDQGTP
jgi:hypothetical protein